MPDLTCCRIESQRQGEVHVVRVEGELDLSGAPDLELALSEAEGTEASLIVLDLEQLTFIDSEGLEILLRASRRSATNGNRLKITSFTGHPAGVLRLTGLDEIRR